MKVLELLSWKLGAMRVVKANKVGAKYPTSQVLSSSTHEGPTIGGNVGPIQAVLQSLSCQLRNCGSPES